MERCDPWGVCLALLHSLYIEKSWWNLWSTRERQGTRGHLQVLWKLPRRFWVKRWLLEKLNAQILQSVILEEQHSVTREQKWWNNSLCTAKRFHGLSRGYNKLIEIFLLAPPFSAAVYSIFVNIPYANKNCFQSFDSDEKSSFTCWHRSIRSWKQFQTSWTPVDSGFTFTD